ncbi:MAG: hypothetical protein R2824_27440 [Saprospiraceae bacterium]|nr:hypothetical protein [Lewinella sp.]
MKWDFFYDVDEGKPYESIDDWHRDISYLIRPGIIVLALGTAIYIYVRFFHS